MSIITAEEFLLQKSRCKNLNEFSEIFNSNSYPEESDGLLSIMKDFAKLHVGAALKAAAENVDLIETDGDPDPETILNAYPLSNIQ